MKITDVIFGSDNTFVRFETDKGKIYYSKGKFYDIHPINCFAEPIVDPLLKEIKSTIIEGNYILMKEVKEFIKKGLK